MIRLGVLSMDRFLRGLVIGFIAVIVKDALNWFSYLVLHFSKSTYAHFMFVMISGRKPGSIFDVAFGQVFELAFGSVVAVAFIYFAYRTKNKSTLWLKGIVFGNAVYLAVFSLGTFFKMPLLYDVPTYTMIATLISTTIYGFLIGMGVYMWGRKLGDWDTGHKNSLLSRYTIAMPVRKMEKKKGKK